MLVIGKKCYLCGNTEFNKRPGSVRDTRNWKFLNALLAGWFFFHRLIMSEAAFMKIQGCMAKMCRMFKPSLKIPHGMTNGVSSISNQRCQTADYWILDVGQEDFFQKRGSWQQQHMAWNQKQD